MPRTLSRRTLLRGASGAFSASLALPLLEAMIPRSASAADAAPKLFGVFFWANGIRKERWVPATTGTAWELTPELTPLSAVKRYVSPITGLEVKDSRMGHHCATGGMLSGTPVIDQSTAPGGENERSTFAKPSIDVVVSGHWQGQTRLRSLELTLLPNRYDEGTTYEQLSHNGPNDVNPAEISPAKAFDRLFGVVDPGAAAAAARRSMLDVLKTDTQALRAKVGVADQRRLDQHLEHVRALELQVKAPGMACTGLVRPADLSANGANLVNRFKAMTEIIALSLSCDLTRVFSISLSRPADNTVLPLGNVSTGTHDLTHGEGGDQPQVNRCATFAIEQLAWLLGRLQATASPTGVNLLDRAAILATSDCQLGNTHDNTEFPILLCGAANGALRAGTHYRSTTAESSTKVLLTMLQALGLPYSSFGTAQLAVSQALPALLA
ncbi:MAG: DUF1552 domain-containing protein [Archangiaceae bacterium]|nr:DUF1552 domain-containing protein [Archangiaceae bacterium]